MGETQKPHLNQPSIERITEQRSPQRKNKYDDAENITNKLHGPWAFPMTPAQREERIFAECTGVVPAKYPPKIKSELFSLL